jgi:hypothetical protein
MNEDGDHISNMIISLFKNMPDSDINKCLEESFAKEFKEKLSELENDPVSQEYREIMNDKIPDVFTQQMFQSTEYDPYISRQPLCFPIIPDLFRYYARQRNCDTQLTMQTLCHNMCCKDLYPIDTDITLARALEREYAINLTDLVVVSQLSSIKTIFKLHLLDGGKVKRWKRIKIQYPKQYVHHHPIPRLSKHKTK